MKKFFSIFATVLAMATIASCNKDNAGSGDTPSPESSSKSTKVEMKLIAEFNADYFKYADYQVKYTAGGQTKTETLTAPAENTRSHWEKTLTFTAQDNITYEVICTPKQGVEYETATKTSGERSVKYVVMNTNRAIRIEIMDFDAKGKQIGNTYGVSEKNEYKDDSGKVIDTHGAGAELNMMDLAIEKDGQPVDNFVGRTLKSFKFEYKVVNSNEEGLTAETAK
jgi:hypothetical protein